MQVFGDKLLVHIIVRFERLRRKQNKQQIVNYLYRSSAGRFDTSLWTKNLKQL